MTEDLKSFVEMKIFIPHSASLPSNLTQLTWFLPAIKNGCVGISLFLVSSVIMYINLLGGMLKKEPWTARNVLSYLFGAFPILF